MDAFIGLIVIVAIIYGACKLLSPSDNQQADNTTTQNETKQSQDHYTSKSTSDTSPKLSKEEIDRIINEAKTSQHYRVESKTTTVSGSKKPVSSSSDTKSSTKPSIKVAPNPVPYSRIEKKYEDVQLKQNPPLPSGNSSIVPKPKTTTKYQTEYEKGKQELDEGIKSGKYRVTQVQGNARTNNHSGPSKKPSYLQPTTKKPPTRPKTTEINPDKLDAYPLPEQKQMLTDYYKTHYFYSNGIGELEYGEVICPKDGHILFKADTICRDELHKQVLCCQKCHTIYPYERVKYIDFTEVKHILYVCKKHTVGTKNNHKTLSVTGFLGLRGGNKFQLNVSYCYQCKRYFILYEAYEIYRRKYGRDIMGDIIFLEDSLTNSNPQVKVESILHEYGYTVNVNSRLTPYDRRRILVWLIDNEYITKTDVIVYLSSFIDRGKKIPSWNNAVLKWQSDLAYIQEYKCDSQQKVNIGSIIKLGH